MTHAAWVLDHAETAPAALLDRVTALLSARLDWAALPTADALLRAGEALIGEVVRHPEEVSRGAALDLLAADACVTWAFEAAASEPWTIVGRASDTMQRIADVGA